MSRARVYADRNCATNGNLTGSSFFGKLVDSINTVAPASNRIRLHRCLLQLIGGDCGGWNTEPGKGLDNRFKLSKLSPFPGETRQFSRKMVDGEKYGEQFRKQNYVKAR